MCILIHLYTYFERPLNTLIICRKSDSSLNALGATSHAACHQHTACRGRGRGRGTREGRGEISGRGGKRLGRGSGSGEKMKIKRGKKRMKKEGKEEEQREVDEEKEKEEEQGEGEEDRGVPTQTLPTTSACVRGSSRLFWRLFRRKGKE